ncbi:MULTISPECIES: DUF1176 domain-containing protein [unclassified Rhizobium]|uniref:DUF1176 domain-containing protein n=2 Tax=unclassified Rhizobium TaxID=2613769 RepID=UPI0013C523EB|nr:MULTISPECIES: DUF1176 domain-containing protein [unclassified Rhizobium]
MALLLASLALGGAANAADPSYDRYKSWLIACDNGLTCEAKGFKNGVISSPDMHVHRAAGPDAVTEVTIGVPFPVGLNDFRADGISLDLGPAWQLSRDEDATTISTSNPAAVMELLSDLRNAAQLEVGAGNAVIPLDGIVAALLHMDDRQDRLGNVTALITRGTAPASSVAAAPALPILARRKIDIALSDEEGQRLILQAKNSGKAVFEAEECQGNTSGEDLKEEAYPLDADHALVFIPCIIGAYQGSSLAFIVPRNGNDAPVPFQPKLPFGGDETELKILTEPGFDMNTGALRMAGRGRAVGDCGLTAEWVWDGMQFQLAEVSYQGTCGGSQLGDWPTLFRTR